MSSAADTPTLTDTAAANPPATTDAPSPSPSAEATTKAPASSAAPTTEPPASSASPTQQPSSAAPQSSAAPSSQAPQSSAAPSASSSEPTSQSAAQSDSSASASSQQATTSAAASSAAASSAAAPSSAVEQTSAVPTLTSAVDFTTTDPAGHTVTTRPAVVTQMSTGTDSNGHLYTVTQIVQNPGGVNDSSGARNGNSTGFFDNTGAVAGTFVVVGLAATAGVLAFVFFMLKRRRRQRLDRDVAAAAAAAAAAAHHSRRDMDDYDDEKISPANSFGGGYAPTDIHGAPQPAMAQFDYEDPAGGYDHYAANLPSSAQDRLSTATAPGLAGFGAQAAQASYGGQNMYQQDEYENLADHPQQHSYPPQSQGGYNPITRHSGGAGQAGGGFYFDPKDAGQFYSDEDAYDYNEEPDSTQPFRSAPHRRPDSAGSVVRDANVTERGLKVTNV